MNSIDIHNQKASKTICVLENATLFMTSHLAHERNSLCCKQEGRWRGGVVHTGQAVITGESNTKSLTQS